MRLPCPSPVRDVAPFVGSPSSPSPLKIFSFHFASNASAVSSPLPMHTLPSVPHPPVARAAATSAACLRICTTARRHRPSCVCLRAASAATAAACGYASCRSFPHGLAACPPLPPWGTIASPRIVHACLLPHPPISHRHAECPADGARRPGAPPALPASPLGSARSASDPDADAVPMPRISPGTPPGCGIPRGTPRACSWRRRFSARARRTVLPGPPGVRPEVVACCWRGSCSGRPSLRWPSRGAPPSPAQSCVTGASTRTAPSRPRAVAACTPGERAGWKPEAASIGATPQLSSCHWRRQGEKPAPSAVGLSSAARVGHVAVA
eukprot:341969-Chlamydomonas_euryale.AAC.2